MQSFGNCEEITNDVKIVLEEKRSKITFINNLKRDVHRIKIDDCIIKEGMRCDYLLIDNADIYYWVELKGTDIKHAIEQLKASMFMFGNKTNQSYSFIISTKVYPCLSSTIQANQKLFKKNYKSDLYIKESPREFNLETKTIK
ncbi:MAG TPA: hypothetical protein PKY56_02425 [Candidatus Kapabacteria bacterium]|nr:hypothetical protein [Candidatus Kapabacteria bacterium]HPO62401.1 hypothetical protein [Candidatus Kapabacteria bacterium]